MGASETVRPAQQTLAGWRAPSRTSSIVTSNRVGPLSQGHTPLPAHILSASSRVWLVFHVVSECRLLYQACGAVVWVPKPAADCVRSRPVLPGPHAAGASRHVRRGVVPKPPADRRPCAPIAAEERGCIVHHAWHCEGVRGAPAGLPLSTPRARATCASAHWSSKAKLLDGFPALACYPVLGHRA